MWGLQRPKAYAPPHNPRACGLTTDSHDCGFYFQALHHHDRMRESSPDVMSRSLSDLVGPRVNHVARLNPTQSLYSYHSPHARGVHRLPPSLSICRTLGCIYLIAKYSTVIGGN